MEQYTYYLEQTGCIVGSGATPRAENVVLPEGCALHRGAQLSGKEFYFVAGRPVAYSEAERERLARRPIHAVRWDIPTKQWIDLRDLAQLRADKWAEIKQARDTLESTSFPYLGKDIQSDARSVLRIHTAAKAADHAKNAKTPFIKKWRCADDTWLDLDGPALQMMPVALDAYIQTLHSRADALREQIDVATSPEAIKAIAWSAP